MVAWRDVMMGALMVAVKEFCWDDWKAVWWVDSMVVAKVLRKVGQ